MHTEIWEKTSEYGESCLLVSTCKYRYPETSLKNSGGKSASKKANNAGFKKIPSKLTEVLNFEMFEPWIYPGDPIIQ